MNYTVKPNLYQRYTATVLCCLHPPSPHPTAVHKLGDRTSSGNEAMPPPPPDNGVQEMRDLIASQAQVIASLQAEQGVVAPSRAPIVPTSKTPPPAYVPASSSSWQAASPVARRYVDDSPQAHARRYVDDSPQPHDPRPEAKHRRVRRCIDRPGSMATLWTVSEEAHVQFK